jgi:hypothetical protein
MANTIKLYGILMTDSVKKNAWTMAHYFIIRPCMSDIELKVVRNGVREVLYII